MAEGGVCFQGLPLFCLTQPGWSRWGMRQAELFAEMIERQEDHVRPVTTADDLDPERPAGDGRIALMAAIENASVFAEEDEHLDEALGRLEQILRLAGPLLYLGLTWNSENRFGGGCDSEKGLKDDGRVLLAHMAEHGIALDLSHASPRLAHDLLDFTYAKGLDLPVLASHSNYAAVVEGPRHLPDEPAREIARRGGVIGLNVLRRFLVGEPPDCFANQLAHAEQLGIGEAQALGTDFFYPDDIPPALRKGDGGEDFHPGFDDISCHQRLLRAIEEAREMEQSELHELAHGRVLRFVRRVLGGSS
jgi:microsomal dipeptidase-like Zn-dependent dipeptidase